MTDFYGSDYLESGWWWPFSYWANRTKARSTAISAWLRKVCAEIQKRFPDAEIKTNTRPVGPGDIIWTDLKVRIASVGGPFVAALGAGDYDRLTKTGLDPAEWVRAQLSGQKWLVDHGRKPPADYGWEG